LIDAWKELYREVLVGAASSNPPKLGLVSTPVKGLEAEPGMPDGVAGHQDGKGPRARLQGTGGFSFTIEKR